MCKATLRNNDETCFRTTHEKHVSLRAVPQRLRQRSPDVHAFAQAAQGLVCRLLPSYKPPALLALLLATGNALLNGLDWELKSTNEFRDLFVRHFLKS